MVADDRAFSPAIPAFSHIIPEKAGIQWLTNNVVADRAPFL